MKRSYNLLVHKSFHEAATETVERFPKLTKSLRTAFEKITADPTKGKAMRDVTNPRLQGVIRRLQVGGRKGHRLIYLHPLKTDLVVPVFLSPVTKPPFEYSKVPWEEMCEEIAEDIRNKRYKNFTNWKLDD